MSINTPRFGSEAREWIWPFALAATIFLASGWSQVATPEVPGIDKIAHFFVFGLLGTLIARVPLVGGWRVLEATWAVVLASLYWASDEFHQSFTPGRSAELADWIADTGGQLWRSLCMRAGDGIVCFWNVRSDELGSRFPVRSQPVCCHDAC